MPSSILSYLEIPFINSTVLFVLRFAKTRYQNRWFHLRCDRTDFLGGSYMAEAFRAGLQSVAKGQIDSAKSIGLQPIQIFRYVIFLKRLPFQFRQ